MGFENERHTICIENDKTEVLVTQIAGLLARRIVSWTDLVVYYNVASYMV